MMKQASPVLRTGCPTCKGTGYIPFVKADGTESQFAQSPCPDCGGYDHKRSYADANMIDWQPEDFDFPCSETWRAYYQGERNKQASTPSTAPLGTLDDRRWDSVQQLRGELNFLANKVNEMRVEKKKRDDNYEPF